MKSGQKYLKFLPQYSTIVNICRPFKVFGVLIFPFIIISGHFWSFFCTLKGHYWGNRKMINIYIQSTNYNEMKSLPETLYSQTSSQYLPPENLLTLVHDIFQFIGILR